MFIALGKARGLSREQLANLLALELQKVGAQDFQATQRATACWDKFDLGLVFLCFFEISEVLFQEVPRMGMAQLLQHFPQLLCISLPTEQWFHVLHAVCIHLQKLPV